MVLEGDVVSFFALVKCSIQHFPELVDEGMNCLLLRNAWPVGEISSSTTCELSDMLDFLGFKGKGNDNISPCSSVSNG
jgi:hypothetical protein